MFAVQFDRFGPPDVLHLAEAPEPRTGPGSIRIRVQAAGVAPVDLALRSGASPSSGSLLLPHIPGVDAAGIVDEVGAGVSGVSVGDEVFGSVDISAMGGATAEFAVLDVWASKPTSMSWAEAGASGTSIETATRALDALDVRDGVTLVIDGASGGVGSVAVQLAVARGARVVGTGRPENQEFIARLGAIPVEYGTGLQERLSALGIDRVDRALDVAGAGSLPGLIRIAGAAASVLSLADFSGPKLGVRLSMGKLAGEPNGRHGLAVAATLSEEDRFTIPIQLALPMSRAAEAHTAAGSGPRQGKISLIARSGSVRPA
jgi:NADPH:quinone reductase-like Zn-dependent oxidoreductase